MKTTSIVNSAERLDNGKSKYIFIGKQGFNKETNESGEVIYKPVAKVVAINQSNGSVELMDLNEVQAMESSYIQENISRGYKPKLGKNE
jgi:hypothetical protein